MTCPAETVRSFVSQKPTVCGILPPALLSLFVTGVLNVPFQAVTFLLCQGVWSPMNGGLAAQNIQLPYEPVALIARQVLACMPSNGAGLRVSSVFGRLYFATTTRPAIPSSIHSSYKMTRSPQ